MKCDKCGNEEALLLTRQNPKGEKGIFWCEKCTHTDIKTHSDALDKALEEPKELRLVFTAEGGYEFEKAIALRVLTIGESYKVTKLVIGGYSSHVELEGSKEVFNTCLFQSNQDLDDIFRGAPYSDFEGLVVEKPYIQNYPRKCAILEFKNQIIYWKTQNRHLSSILKDIARRESLEDQTGVYHPSKRFPNKELQELEKKRYLDLIKIQGDKIGLLRSSCKIALYTFQ